MGEHRLHRGQRDHPAAHQLAVGPLRATELLHRIDRHLHRGVVLLRQRAHAGRTGGSPGGPGDRWRRPHQHGAGHPLRRLPRQGAGDRPGHFRDGGHGRADAGADARRLDHRQLRLALDLLHQPAPRRHGGDPDVAARAGAGPRPRTGRPRGLDRTGAPHPRDRLAPDPARAGGEPGLVRLTRDRGRDVRRGDRARRVRVARAHDRASDR